jgi:hypothetical protein
MRLPQVYLALFAALLPTVVGCLALGNREKADGIRPQGDAAAYLADPLARGQLVLHADFRLPADHRLIDELVAERDWIGERLALSPSNEPIHIRLFADEANYHRYVAQQFPGFPERRAIFVETDVKLAVYAHWGDTVAEDLRHEVAHGYLHAAVPNLPLWIDEGLAEYLEGGRGRRGINRAHIEYLTGQLAVGGWKPDLARLERLTAAATMTQLDYAESWLWVHFLLESNPDRAQLVTSYLADLTKDEPTAPLTDRIARQMAHPEPALLEHLASLAPQP